jgi:shikimate dehydrogenase
MGFASLNPSYKYVQRGTARMITGRTEIIGHLGYPTESFTAPMIYNPWFEHRGIDAVVVPMGVKTEDSMPLFCGRCSDSATSGARW